MRVPIEFKNEISKIAKSRKMSTTKYLLNTTELHKNADYLGRVIGSFFGDKRRRGKWDR